MLMTRKKLAKVSRKRHSPGRRIAHLGIPSGNARYAAAPLSDPQAGLRQAQPPRQDRAMLAGRPFLVCAAGPLP
jgi:hypothetical protein